MAESCSDSRFLPVSFFIYKSQEVKPIDKWSTYIKIQKSEVYVNVKNRFCVADYGGIKKRAPERGKSKTAITLCLKD